MSSRAYYLSNENMSEIKESIDDEYSMNFDQYSHGQSRSEITEMISGSHQITQSRNQPKHKQLPKAPIIEEEQPEQIEGQMMEQKQQKAVYLGDQIFANIKVTQPLMQEKYFETNKITTEDPEVLFQFYRSQRKTMNAKGGKPLAINKQELEKMMPSMQRKMLVKMNFQKILTYYPNDVYYSLCVFADKMTHDREINQKANLFHQQMAKDQKKKKNQNQINQIVQKLYQKKGQPEPKPKEQKPEQVEKKKRLMFGRNLSEVFQNVYREKGEPYNVQTLDKLYTYWEDTYERDEYGIEWDEATAKSAIRLYMYEQVQDLLQKADKKYGFRSQKQHALKNFYKNNKIDNIFIPLNSFQEYLKLYNQVQKEKQQQLDKKQESYQTHEELKKKKHEAKQFGRPVSATPITILSKPKNKVKHESYDTLMEKFPNDKFIKQLVGEENLKRPRYAFQYGQYNIEEQIKTKQWIKPDPKKAKVKYDDTINKMLFQTYSNPTFVKDKDKDQLTEIFGEDYLEADEHWKELGPIMHECMLVKAHQQSWFRDCIIKYLERKYGQNYKLETNNLIFNKLFKHLNEIEEDERKLELHKLENLIMTSEEIAAKTEKINHLEFRGKGYDQKDKRLFDNELQEKAKEFVEMRIKKKNDKFQLRKYLNDFFEQMYKEHKELVRDNFHVVENEKGQPLEKECPKLLKYEFFRRVREINPIILEKNAHVKSHAWVPPKNTPAQFNYKTYNQFAEAYTKNKNIIVAQLEKDQCKTTLWGRRNGKEREKLMMTYDDAKECTFQPKISRKVV